MMKQLNIEDMEDDDDEAIDKGVWGASPIVDVQLSTSDLEEARLQKDGYERVLTAGDGEFCAAFGASPKNSAPSPPPPHLLS